jgi:hypothetical protein
VDRDLDAPRRDEIQRPRELLCRRARGRQEPQLHAVEQAQVQIHDPARMRAAAQQPAALVDRRHDVRPQLGRSDVVDGRRDPMAVRQRLDGGREVLRSGVADRVGRAGGGQRAELRRIACGGDHSRPEQAHDLHRRQTEATRRPDDQHAIFGADATDRLDEMEGDRDAVRGRGGGLE